jgi:glycyl-tRNA synthetase beta chain
LDFLLEIGCEEIPARMLDAAAEELARRVGQLLVRERLAAKEDVQVFATPRRLAVTARGLAASQPDVAEQVTGPSWKVAYKDGKATPAAEAFAKRVGVDVGALKKVTTAKGEYLGADVLTKGRPAPEVLSDLLPKEIAALYWAKNMYWRAGKPELFVRPVRWITALLDGEVVPVAFAGIRAGRNSRGHRIIGTAEVAVAKAGDYAAALQAAKVVVDPAARELRIRKALDAATRQVAGARWREDTDLLKTVVNLTEWPSAVLGSFDREFLSLPEEVLVTVMRDHQKYFAVEDAQGKLTNHFLAVLNTDGDPDGLIRHGNERVLRARFNDARFFWDFDQKQPLKQRVEGLKAVTFQKDLGSYYGKAERVSRLVNQLGADLANSGVKLDRNALHEAAWLAKTDLTTELVKEFTELQGIVGGLYARAQDLGEPVAAAIYDHYKPESMEDAAPRTVEGAVLAIADKADSIAGMFALGMVPSGSKDPFALRRQANGIVKTIAEHKLRLRLSELMSSALEGYKGSEAEARFPRSQPYLPAVTSFFRERLEYFLKDAQGFAYDVVNAVLAAGADDVVDALARAQAVAEVRPSEDFESISVAFKRMKNILKQAAEKGLAVSERFSTEVLQEAAERELATQVPRIAAAVGEYKQQGNYPEGLRQIAALRPLVDAFFDKVMVMVEDERVRANRLALLQTLVRDFSTIADFSEIVTEKK